MILGSCRFRIASTAAVSCLTLAAAVGLSSCQKSGPTPPPDPHQALVTRGRVVYLSVCIACHNPDPRKPGALGPEIWGSSLELIQARVMNAAYPAGYSPKRTTHVMQALPQYQKDLAALQAYLNSP